jgi:hypothetical protein
MKIDVSNGSIAFKSGEIQRAVDRASLLSSAIGKDATEELVNAREDWWHISIDPDVEVGAILIFRGEQLHQVFLSMKLQSDDRQQWSTARELERKAKHDAWLQSTLGPPPYIFPWGTIASEFDAKGCASDIIVTYAT